MMVTSVKPSGSAVTISVSYIHYAEPISPPLHYRRKLTVFILDIFNEDFKPRGAHVPKLLRAFSLSRFVHAKNFECVYPQLL